MRKAYTIADARAHLAEILDEVEGGRDIELTRRGKQVAVVLSAARYARLRGRVGAFSDAYDRFLSRHCLDEVGVDRLWAPGLRDRGTGRRVKL